MNKETIKKAAYNYTLNDKEGAKDIYELNVKEEIASTAFVVGAHWRINSVWHEANKEIPIPFRPILVEHDDGRFSVNMVGGNMKSCPLAWARWAYIDDLLPYGKEADR